MGRRTEGMDLVERKRMEKDEKWMMAGLYILFTRFSFSHALQVTLLLANRPSPIQGSPFCLYAGFLLH
jgi:hypothetical protein